MNRLIYQIVDAGARRAASLELDYILDYRTALSLAWHECIEYWLPFLSEQQREQVAREWDHLIRVAY